MEFESEILILGAGAAGISSSFHCGHDRCTILEQSATAFGHCRSVERDGIFWDEGPHVSFTNSEYVRELFSDSIDGEVCEFNAVVGNYFEGAWISHPAQVNLHQVPEPLRSDCLESFLQSEKQSGDLRVTNYKEWLDAAFGEVFATTFASAYTSKYWTCTPDFLETSWVGGRVYRPSRDDVCAGSTAPLPNSKHYINRIRYPKTGGYEKFFYKMKEGANIKFNNKIIVIDLKRKYVKCSNGDVYRFNRLISTIPLPKFVKICRQATIKIRNIANSLSYTSGILVNVVIPHEDVRPEHWLYVYDLDKISTRITFASKLDGVERSFTGLQVEVYESKYRRLKLTDSQVIEKVIQELYSMGLIKNTVSPEDIIANVSRFNWGNVIFDHNRAKDLDKILEWLSSHGLSREPSDLAPSTDSWDEVKSISNSTVVLAGRYAQWKYYWSDDCVLRGKQIADAWDC